MACLAYIGRRNGNIAVEEWDDHALGTLSIVRKCFPYLPDLLAERLNIDEGVAHRIVWLSAAMHDLGKTLNIYQEWAQLVYAGRISKATYYGHEAVSAYLLDRYVLREVLGASAEEGDVAALLTVVGAAMHHHAMRSMADWWIRLIHPTKMLDALTRIANKLGIKTIRITDDCLAQICRVLHELSLSNDSVNSVINHLRNAGWESPRQLVTDMLRWYTVVARHVEQLPKPYLLVVGPMVVADNVTAAMNRGGSLAPWLRELEAINCLNK